MFFEIQQRAAEGITILDLRGRLVQGHACTDLRERIDALRTQQIKNVILNFKHVDFIDSSGLGMLVAVHSLLQQDGGDAMLLNLHKRSLELLILTKLSTVFKIYDDDQAAINGFFPDREVKRFDILEFVQSQTADPEPESA
jgi:anti-sigma B factor antagonist